jgi:EF-hand domain-containing protein 1
VSEAACRACVRKRFGHPRGAQSIKSRKAGEGSAVTTRRLPEGDVPPHVKKAGLTLTFFGYFLESVPESRVESSRVRKLTITYFLEDDTVGITEAALPDSGIPQGKFLRRGKVPLGKTAHGITALGKDHGILATEGRFVTLKDLVVGASLDVFGRVIRITACDPATRKFYEATPGLPRQPADASAPRDGFTDTRRSMMQRDAGQGGGFHGKLSSPVKRYAEARLGNPSGRQTRAAPDTLGRFMKYGGVTLAFMALADDTDHVYGERVNLRLLVHPEDDTVEVTEVYPHNMGRNPRQIKVFTRARLPRHPILHDDRQRSIEDDNGDEDYFTAAEFHIGAKMNVLGRPIVIYDADPATLKWLADKGEMLGSDSLEATSKAGVTLTATGSLRDDKPSATNKFVATSALDGLPNDDLEAEEAATTAAVALAGAKAVPGPSIEPPPYGGFGTEEDSLGSFFNLLPMYPRRDLSRATKFEGMALKFKAKIAPHREPGVVANTTPDDPLAGAMTREEAETKAVSEGVARIDASREFVVTWFMENETLTVYEPPQRNSGVIGGKFLSRRRLRNIDTGDFFRDEDFFVGANLLLGGHRFHLYDAEGFTRKLLKGQAKVWGSSDVKFVLNNLRTKFADFSLTMRRAFRSMDKDYSGSITMDELQTQLRKWNFVVSRDELVQIFNFYDRGHTGKWTFDDFCAAFTDPDYGSDAGGVKRKEGDTATLLTDDELRAYEEHVTTVSMDDAEKERLTRLLEKFAQEFAARSGEERMAQEFRRVDLDKSNTVDRDEFRHALTVSFQLREEDAELLEKHFFRAGQTELDYEAFMQHLRGMLRRSTH